MADNSTQNNTTNAKLAYIKSAPSTDFHKKYISFTKVVDDFGKEVDLAYRHHKSKVSNDPISEEISIFKAISEIGDSMDPEFLSFWIDKFHTAHEKVKEAIDSDVFFRDFSENMGSITMVNSILDRSTLAVLDTDSNLQNAPEQYPATLEYTVDSSTKILTRAFSKITNSVFRRGIVVIGEPQKQESDGNTTRIDTHSVSLSAHGVNFVTDKEHYNRMNRLAADLIKDVNISIKGLKRVLSFIRKKVEAQEINKELIITKLNELELKTNFLGHDIGFIKPALNNSRLGVGQSLQSLQSLQTVSSSSSTNSVAVVNVNDLNQGDLDKASALLLDKIITDDKFKGTLLKPAKISLYAPEVIISVPFTTDQRLIGIQTAAIKHPELNIHSTLVKTPQEYINFAKSQTGRSTGDDIHYMFTQSIIEKASSKNGVTIKNYEYSLDVTELTPNEADVGKNIIAKSTTITKTINN